MVLGGSQLLDVPPTLKFHVVVFLRLTKELHTTFPIPVLKNRALTSVNTEQINVYLLFAYYK